MTPPPYLTDEEIAAICAPLTQPAAQTRHLREKYRLLVKQKPNGRPLVSRSHFEKVMGGTHTNEQQGPAEEQPDESALILEFKRRANRRKNKKE
jgi:hypothetical protein